MRTTQRAMRRRAGISAGLVLLLAASLPAEAQQHRDYIPQFFCAAPQMGAGGSCSVDLDSGIFQLDVAFPHGPEAALTFEVSTPDGSTYRTTCEYIEYLGYQRWSCEGEFSGPSIRLIRSGGSGGQYIGEEYADLELYTPGRASVTVEEGTGVATLRGRGI